MFVGGSGLRQCHGRLTNPGDDLLGGSGVLREQGDGLTVGGEGCAVVGRREGCVCLGDGNFSCFRPLDLVLTQVGYHVPLPGDEVLVTLGYRGNEVECFVVQGFRLFDIARLEGGIPLVDQPRGLLNGTRLCDKGVGIGRSGGALLLHELFEGREDKELGVAALRDGRECCDRVLGEIASKLLDGAESLSVGILPDLAPYLVVVAHDLIGRLLFPLAAVGELAELRLSVGQLLL